MKQYTYEEILNLEEKVERDEEKLKEIDAELEKYVGILSNYQNKLDKISLICSNTSSYWKTSDLETRKRIQKLAFPDGIFYDREKGNYRTFNKNVIYKVIDKLSDGYKQKEGEKPSDFSPSVKLCAGWDSNSHDLATTTPSK